MHPKILSAKWKRWVKIFLLFSLLHDTELWYTISEIQEICLFDAPLNILISLRHLWYISWLLVHMIASSNGNIFRVTGPLCGEFASHRWIPLPKASDAGLWCFLWSMPWINGWVNNRDADDLRRHRAHYVCNVMVPLSTLRFHWNIHCGPTLAYHLSVIIAKVWVVCYVQVPKLRICNNLYHLYIPIFYMDWCTISYYYLIFICLNLHLN